MSGRKKGGRGKRGSRDEGLGTQSSPAGSGAGGSSHQAGRPASADQDESERTFDLPERKKTSEGKGKKAEGKGKEPAGKEPMTTEDKLQEARKQQKAEERKAEKSASKPESAEQPKTAGRKFPDRPDYGEQGKKMTVFANYFELRIDRNLVLHLHAVKIRNPANTEEEIIGRKKERLFRLLLETPELRPHKNDIVTDFRTCLISRSVQLAHPNQLIRVHYRREDEDPDPAKDIRYDATIEYVKPLQVSQLLDYLTSTQWSAAYEDQGEMIQAFNIYFNHYAKSNASLVKIGASKAFNLSDTATKFHKDCVMPLGQGLLAARGFFTSVRAATTRVLVNTNVSYGAFYDELSLPDLMRQSQTEGHGPGPEPQNWNMFKINGFLRNLRVRTTHKRERRNRAGKVIRSVEKISGLASRQDGREQANPPDVPYFGAGPNAVRFWQQLGSVEGQYITVYNYFVTKYGVHTNAKLPVVNVGNRKSPKYLPADVCHVLPFQPARTTLNTKQAQNMIGFTVRTPRDNMASILDGGWDAAGLAPEKNPLLSRFGFAATRELIKVDARVLPSPQVTYRFRDVSRNEEVNTNAYIQNGAWNMVPNKKPLRVNRSGATKTWAVLQVFTTDNSNHGQRPLQPDEIQTLVAKFKKVVNEMGVQLGEKRPDFDVRCHWSNRGCQERRLSELFEKVKSWDVRLLLVFLPGGPIPVYNTIKKLGDVQYGIHTICSVFPKLREKPDNQIDQYFRNEVLKLNLKLGGTNQLVNTTRGDIDPTVDLTQGTTKPPGAIKPLTTNKKWAREILQLDTTMVVGIDVTHPSPGSAEGAPSVAGMVASIGWNLAQWPAVLGIQENSRQEMVSCLEDMMASRLDLWRKANGEYPSNILVYRDGVSEGQYLQVLEYEVPRLRAACHKKYEKKYVDLGWPRLTVVIVGKRHHTRFYPTDEGSADARGNTPTGTVVDRGVTEAHTWDFFLQAHEALKGTVRPGHYIVVLDEIFGRGFQYIKKFKNVKENRADREQKLAKANLADELQILTQEMCYAFGRCTRAVGICTPAYYADILCERARCYLSNVFDPDSASDAGSVAGSDKAPAITEEQRKAKEEARLQLFKESIMVHEKLKDTMFYI